jgi:hypothetical protein
MVLCCYVTWVQQLRKAQMATRLHDMKHDYNSFLYSSHLLADVTCYNNRPSVA